MFAQQEGDSGNFNITNWLGRGQIAFDEVDVVVRTPSAWLAKPARQALVHTRGRLRCLIFTRCAAWSGHGASKTPTGKVSDFITVSIFIVALGVGRLAAL